MSLLPPNDEPVVYWVDATNSQQGPEPLGTVIARVIHQQIPDSTLVWWDELDQTVYNPNLVQNSGEFYNLDANGQPYYDTDGKTQINSYFPTNAGQYNRTRGTKSEANPTYEPWLGAPSMYGGVWAQVNTNQSVPFSYSQPE